MVLLRLNYRFDSYTRRPVKSVRLLAEMQIMGRFFDKKNAYVYINKETQQVTKEILKNLDPKMREEIATQIVDIPEDIDAELLAKVLENPEMKALLASLAKTMK